MLCAYHLSGDITLGMHEYLMIILRKHVSTGMAEQGGRWAHATFSHSAEGQILKKIWP